MGLLLGTRAFRAWRNTCTVGVADRHDVILPVGETDGSPLYDDGTHDTDASHAVSAPDSGKDVEGYKKLVEEMT